MSMIETYRKCSKLSDAEKVDKCFWFYFFDPKTSIKRLHPYAVFHNSFGNPNTNFREFIEGWWDSEDRNVSPLLYYFMKITDEIEAEE